MGSKLSILVKSAAFVAASYLYGSLPFVHSLARARGVNLRVTGSRTVGGSNLWQHTSPAAGTAGWALDVSKGALPVLLGRSLGLPPGATAAGATAGVAGQCWPVFLAFDGGRGVSAILGASATLAPRETAVMLVPMTLGSSVRAVPLLWRTKDRRLKELALLHGENSRAVPLSVGLSLVGLPLLAAAGRRPPETVLACFANAALLLLRRLTANVEELKHSKNPFPLLVSRLLYDRDPSPKEVSPAKPRAAAGDEEPGHDRRGRPETRPYVGRASRSVSSPRATPGTRPRSSVSGGRGSDGNPSGPQRLSMASPPVYSSERTLVTGGDLWW